mmetsp:Transcript_7059/g.25992  ORF Transcript_7059/g.25992 Transcript_7059/m.25992 type:complete len:118 (+) Transcript_7059:50-403(+)
MGKGKRKRAEMRSNKRAARMLVDEGAGALATEASGEGAKMEGMTWEFGPPKGLEGDNVPACEPPKEKLSKTVQKLSFKQKRRNKQRAEKALAFADKRVGKATKNRAKTARKIAAKTM